MSWVGEAMNWVGRITPIACEMVLPGLAGVWLDRQLGTQFLAFVGFALGLGLAVREVQRLGEHR